MQLSCNQRTVGTDGEVQAIGRIAGKGLPFDIGALAIGGYGCGRLDSFGGTWGLSDGIGAIGGKTRKGPTGVVRPRYCVWSYGLHHSSEKTAYLVHIKSREAGRRVIGHILTQ